MVVVAFPAVGEVSHYPSGRGHLGGRPGEGVLPPADPAGGRGGPGRGRRDGGPAFVHLGQRPLSSSGRPVPPGDVEDGVVVGRGGRGSGSGAVVLLLGRRRRRAVGLGQLLLLPRCFCLGGLLLLLLLLFLTVDGDDSDVPLLRPGTRALVQVDGRGGRGGGGGGGGGGRGGGDGGRCRVRGGRGRLHQRRDGLVAPADGASAVGGVHGEVGQRSGLRAPPGDHPGPPLPVIPGSGGRGLVQVDAGKKGTCISNEKFLS